MKVVIFCITHRWYFRAISQNLTIATRNMISMSMVGGNTTQRVQSGEYYLQSAATEQ